MEIIRAPNGVALAWAIELASQARPQCVALLERRSVSRFLLRELLTLEVQRGFQLVQSCSECGSADHGQVRVQLLGGGPASRQGPDPMLEDQQLSHAPLVSASYAGSLTVVGVAPPTATSFGIDVEFDTPETRRAVAEALECPADQVEPRYWTRLEAAAKACGRGLRGDWHSPDTNQLAFFEVPFPEVPDAVVSVALG